MWYASPLNSSMARVNYFHKADSYSSSLNSGMVELLKTLFQSYSNLVFLSHLYQKKSYSLITLTFSISLSLSQSRHHLALALTLPHALNLALTLPHALNLPLSLALALALTLPLALALPLSLVLALPLYSPSCSPSVLSLSICIFRLESQGTFPLTQYLFEHLRVRVIYGYIPIIGIGINLWVICGYENLLGLYHIDALYYVVLINNFYILFNCCDFDNMIGLHFLQWWLL